MSNKPTETNPLHVAGLLFFFSVPIAVAIYITRNIDASTGISALLKITAINMAGFTAGATAAQLYIKKWLAPGDDGKAFRFFVVPLVFISILLSVSMWSNPI